MTDYLVISAIMATLMLTHGACYLWGKFNERIQQEKLRHVRQRVPILTVERRAAFLD